eukprot:SAG25_NODE_533_length_7143_cov_4.173623_9_plen_105_part_00
MSKQQQGANTWVAEWRISFELLQIRPGKQYKSTMPDTEMSMNIALGDVDTPKDGCPPTGSCAKSYGIRHEMWPCGNRAGRTHLCQFCKLIMMQGKKPTKAADVK